ARKESFSKPTIMTEFYNNTLCVQSGWLMASGIVSKTNYRNLTQRDQINILRRGCRNTPALVEYDSIPERFKKEIVKKVGDLKKTTKHIVFKDYLQHDQEAKDFYDGWTIPDGSA